MLIEFSVENFMSIKDEARLSLAAGPGKEHRETHVMTPELNEGVRSIPLVRSAAIYGANAAGKTNLILALGAMRHFIVESARELRVRPVTPFRFAPECEGKPTTFEVVGIANHMRFQYGFSAIGDIVTEEWLYAWPRGRIQFWFERTTDSGMVRYKFGDKLSGDKEVWRRATRRNALLLSTAVTLNSEQLRPVYDWFSSNLFVTGLGGWEHDFSVEWCRSNRKAELIQFLRAADLAIDDVRVDVEDFSPAILPEDMPKELTHRVREELSGAKVVQVHMSHGTRHGQSVELDLGDESHGTQKMFALAAPWIDTFDNGHVIAVDELHNSLHPALVRFLVDRFHDPELNANGAQLLFTTHDTSILSQDVFRRDQIWFCERNARQETNLFPLTDFRPRRGVENLERAYLGGRYGAVPYVRPSRVGSDA